MQDLSRRDFVKRGAGLAAVTLPFAHIEAAAALARAATSTAPPLGRSRFIPLVGGVMRMSDGSRSVQVRLTKVRDLQSARTPGDERCFSLLFEASPGSGWPQQTYRFSNPKLGAVSLFAVPGSLGGKVYYEAVINSPTRPA
ncbi:MAG: hypothetical protein QOF77_845 [Solirubrobacteraceae bacterium]|jgi:hypothetical protein|nr:hypothetical protein [Solirubrobacteraceae bacterium]